MSYTGRCKDCGSYTYNGYCVNCDEEHFIEEQEALNAFIEQDENEEVTDENQS